jgi:phage terminase small subunit
MAKSNLAELTRKQKLFVEYYLANGLNASQAMISAGYSEDSALQASYRMLRVPKVMAEINKSQNRTMKKLGYDQERLIKELEDAQKLAMETNNPSAHIKATEVKAKLLGMNEPEKKELNITSLPGMIIDGDELNNI